MRAKRLLAASLMSCVAPYTVSDPRPLPALERAPRRALDARGAEQAIRGYVLMRTPRRRAWTDELLGALRNGGANCVARWPTPDILVLNCECMVGFFDPGRHDINFRAPSTLSSISAVLRGTSHHVAELSVVGSVDRQTCCEQFRGCPAASSERPPPVCSDCAGQGQHLACNACLAWCRAATVRQALLRGASGVGGLSAGAGTCWHDSHSTDCQGANCPHARRIDVAVRFEHAAPCSIAMRDPASTLFCYQEIVRRDGDAADVGPPAAPASAPPPSACVLDLAPGSGPIDLARIALSTP